MRAVSALTLLLTIPYLTSAAYVVQDDYTPSKFASMFDFFTDNDPTQGYVNYIDQASAQSSGLFKAQNDSVYMGVDSTNKATGRGRDSVRITSKNSYTHGLFILDLAHMPGSQCGTWPAFWLLGPNWPNSGELDIIEGVNSQTSNSMALHTNSGCSITKNTVAPFSGNLNYANCDSYAPNQPSNVGCSIGSSNDQSYGTGFNAIGGGIYATEWTSSFIKIWFFPRSAIPADLTSGNPQPGTWGDPLSAFSGACDLDQKIFNQQIVFDVTFCGTWAGQVWSSDPVCASKANTCVDYVRDNPTAFTETYWDINSLKVYKDNGSAAPAPSAPAVVPTSTVVVSSAQPTTQPQIQTQTQSQSQTLTQTRTTFSTITVTLPASAAGPSTATATAIVSVAPVAPGNDDRTSTLTTFFTMTVTQSSSQNTGLPTWQQIGSRSDSYETEDENHYGTRATGVLKSWVRRAWTELRVWL